jgi:hypothetical protein
MVPHYSCPDILLFDPRFEFLNPDSAVQLKRRARDKPSRSEVDGSLPYESLLVPIVPKVPMVPTPSFILRRRVGEERGGGLNSLNVLNLVFAPSRFNLDRAGA